MAFLTRVNKMNGSAGLMLSVLMTVAVVFAPRIVDASESICSRFFEPESEKSLDDGLAKELSARGLPVRNLRSVPVAVIDASIRVQNEKPWYVIRNEWFQASKNGDKRLTLERQADVIEGAIKLLRSFGFSTRIELGDTPRIIAIDKTNPLFRREFDLNRIFLDKQFATQEFDRLETIILTRALEMRARKISLADSDITTQGFILRNRLREFSSRSDSDLESLLNVELKILSKKTYDLQAGLQAAMIAGEMLVRRGFVTELLPSARGVFLARVVNLISGTSSEFTQVLEAANLSNGSWFVIDPTFYSFARKSGGVSDTQNFDYSVNTKRLWDRPEDFERPSGTLIHEIYHLENARIWLDRPADDFAQSLNGFLWATGRQDLGTKSYKKYFQIDEIPAAVGDAESATDHADIKKYADRAIDLSDAVLKRLQLIRYQVSHGQFTTSLTSTGQFLKVEIGNRPMSAGSGEGFVYRFRDLDYQTPRYTIVKRVLQRLDILESRVQGYKAAAATIQSPVLN